MRNTSFVLDTEHSQPGAINHCAVSCLIGTLKMGFSRDAAYFYFIIVGPVILRVFLIVSSHIGQHPDKGAVIIPDRSFAAANHRGNQLVKFPVPANQELYTALFGQEPAAQYFQFLLDCQRIFYYTVAEEATVYSFFDYFCFILYNVVIYRNIFD